MKTYFFNRNTFFWIVVVTLTLAALGAIFFFNNKFYQEYLAEAERMSRPSAVYRPPSRLFIDFGDRKKRAFEGEVRLGMTAADALVLSGKVGNFSVKISEDGKGVLSIAGVGNNRRKKWKLYIDDRKILPDVDTPLRRGELVTFVYE